MSNKDYIRKEVRTLYKYILDDKEEFKAKKHLYARIYNSLESIFECEVNGLETLGFTKEEIKEIIKEEVENFHK